MTRRINLDEDVLAAATKLAEDSGRTLAEVYRTWLAEGSKKTLSRAGWLSRGAP